MKTESKTPRTDAQIFDLRDVGEGNFDGDEKTPLVKASVALKLEEELAAAQVPFLFKQWGEWLPDTQNPEISGHSGPTQAIKLGKKKAGRDLDGVLHNAFPVIRANS